MCCIINIIWYNSESICIKRNNMLYLKNKIKSKCFCMNSKTQKTRASARFLCAV
jgi:hypothetical protein